MGSRSPSLYFAVGLDRRLVDPFGEAARPLELFFFASGDFDVDTESGTTSVLEVYSQDSLVMNVDVTRPLCGDILCGDGCFFGTAFSSIWHCFFSKGFLCGLIFVSGSDDEVLLLLTVPLVSKAAIETLLSSRSLSASPKSFSRSSFWVVRDEIITDGVVGTALVAPDGCDVVPRCSRLL